MKNKVLFHIRLVTLMSLVLLATCCTSQLHTHSVNQLDKRGNKSGSWIELEGNPNEEQIMVLCHYKKGVRHGAYRAYYMEGPLHSEGKYLNGNQVGKWIGYQENGTISWWEIFDKNGEVLSMRIYNIAW